MNNKDLKNKIVKQAQKDLIWFEEANNRQLNSSWLDFSFKIALKVLRYLRVNNISQKKLADELSWSPQYLSKVLKGKENLTLDTICKIQNTINIELIKVPSFKYEILYEIENTIDSLYHEFHVRNTPTAKGNELVESKEVVESEEAYSQMKNEKSDTDSSKIAMAA